MAQLKRNWLVLFLLVGVTLLSIPVREVKHSSDLSRAFGKLSQEVRDQSWGEAKSTLFTLRRELLAIPSASLLTHWQSEREALLQQEILMPLEFAIEQQSTVQAQSLIATLSLDCTRCHNQSGRRDLPVRKRPTASNVIGE